MFAGTHTEVHHQCFRMVDLLMRHFEQGLRTLNPCAEPCVPNRVEEVKETSKNDVEMNELNEVNCDWKIPRETRVKRNMTDQRIHAELNLPQGELLRKAKVIGRTKDGNGDIAGSYDPNLFLNALTYDFEFSDCEIKECFTNVK